MVRFPGFDGHESLHLFEDAQAGFRAAIAIHSTVRGPAAGGCRVWEYEDADAMSRDALALARAMSYKSAVAELPLGGGKAVIHRARGEPNRPAMFEALGRAVQSLNGRFWVAGDVGVSPQDLAHAARQCDHVAGLAVGKAASGDSSPVTARGVLLGIERAAARLSGGVNLEDLSVAIQGVGGVGGHLCRLLAARGARMIVADLDAARADAIAAETGAAVCEPEAIFDADTDIFSPCALGGVITAAVVPRLRCRIVAGGANNPLSDPSIAAALQARNIIYVPDFAVNGGGIINLAGEILGRYEPEWVEGKLNGLADTVDQILARAEDTGQTPAAVADALARERLRPIEILE